MLNRPSIFKAVVFIPVLLATQTSIADCIWIQNGHQAICSMYFPQAKKENTTGNLAVSYEQKYGCKPVLSFIFMHGTRLGEPKNQQRISSPEKQLSLVINGRTFTEQTNATLYSNGMEYAIYASPALIHALSVNSDAVVKPGGVGTFDFSNDKNFALVNSRALANCR